MMTSSSLVFTLQGISDSYVDFKGVWLN